MHAADVYLMPQPKTVLVVDDEPFVLVFIRELLTEEGFEVVEATNATEALSIMRARSDVDVVLSDIEMPGNFNGIFLSWEVRRLWPAMPILLMSGRTFPGSTEMPTGTRFLAKPANPQLLIDAVRGAS
jgi:two-component system, response regulator PdtaR